MGAAMTKALAATFPPVTRTNHHRVLVVIVVVVAVAEAVSVAVAVAVTVTVAVAVAGRFEVKTSGLS